jgi:ferrous iron transport protein A
MLLNCNINERQVMAAVGQSSKERPCSPLGRAQRRFCGQIHAIELGFTEGASVEILHEGIFGRDPIAVRVNGATVALRRREAMAILVT